MFVGWDWASTTHDVTVLDEAGAVVDRWALRPPSRTGRGADRRPGGEPAALPVIIERTSGLVVDRLVAAGIRWCRCTPPRSGRRVRAGRVGASPTPATATAG